MKTTTVCFNDERAHPEELRFGDLAVGAFFFWQRETRMESLCQKAEIPIGLVNTTIGFLYVKTGRFGFRSPAERVIPVEEIEIQVKQ